jgi:predicted transcriptional regulator
LSSVTLEVSSREATNRRFRRAMAGETQGAVISFETPALLFKVLTEKRWELLAAVTGEGPLSLREAARRVGRDVKAVHRDVHALLGAGQLRKTEAGRIVFPFDAVRVSFELRAA